MQQTKSVADSYSESEIEGYPASTYTKFSIIEFLRTVVTTERGWFRLAVYKPEEGWKEEWYEWPSQIYRIVDRAVRAAGADYNVYFSSYLFKQKQGDKGSVLPSRTIIADLDNADTDLLPLDPTVLVETSLSRYQAFWVLSENELTDLITHEQYSKKITYAIDKCDRSGWPVGHMARLPGTFNFKYDGEGQLVEVRSVGRANYTLSDFELLPDNTAPVAGSGNGDGSIVDDLEFIEKPPHLDIGPQELFFSVKSTVSDKVVPYFNTVSSDRSAALWALTCALFRAALPREQVFWLAKHSANNKFSVLRYHADRELAKDVLRAQRLVSFGASDPRVQISEIRKKRGNASEKNSLIQEIVLDSLKKTGTFHHCLDESLWYVRTDIGRPITVSPHSEWMRTLLDRQFGLNPTENEASYVGWGLMGYTKEIPSTAQRQSLSYYDTNNNLVLLHTGQRDVIRITRNSIARVKNGANGVVFPWPMSMEPFSPIYDAECDWATELFGKSVDHVQSLTPEDAKTLLQIWLLFLLFKSSSVSRPILAIFGQPGAGKSTIFRLVYALLYGKQRALSGVTTPDDFDYAVSNDPLLVLDNVDTWEKWLPDRLAQSAATSDLPKRKLYTDVDVIKVRRQALLGITAHNPKFGREDVADRLLLITLERLPFFAPEGEMINYILERRHRLWGGIVRDVQAVLNTPYPTPDEAPQFRVEDFARTGAWIAATLKKSESFRRAIASINRDQKSFVLEEDAVLVGAIRTYIRRSASADEFKSVGRLWLELESYSQDPMIFARIHKNAVNLQKKLWTLQPALKEVFDIAFKPDTDGSRLWRIAAKQ